MSTRCKAQLETMPGLMMLAKPETAVNVTGRQKQCKAVSMLLVDLGAIRMQNDKGPWAGEDQRV